MSNDINTSLDALFGKMENFVSSKTVVGEPVYFGETIVLPLVDVSFGVGAGAFDNQQTEKSKSEVGGGGLGASITPAAVLVINGANVQLVNIKNQDSINKLIDMVPGILNKLNLNGIFSKDKTSSSSESSDDSANADTTEI